SCCSTTIAQATRGPGSNKASPWRGNAATRRRCPSSKRHSDEPVDGDCRQPELGEHAPPRLELADESPRLARHPALALALVFLRGIVISPVCTPAHGVALHAALVRGTDMSAAVWRGFRRVLRGAAVDLHEA